mmetsp:Transcript_34519/g.104126  ORF Transcript_34519/g.104126 Transcript_34519/m.104126 type:complete len:378 (-) Transcript_34519:30-1163(-)
MSDEEKRKGQKPVVTLADALTVLEEHWGFDPKSFTSIKVLDSYDDCNFYVECGAKRYLMKCYNGVESDNPPIIDAQTAMMELLSRNDVATSRTVKCVKSGDNIAWPQLSVFDGSERRCAVRLCDWLDGQPLVGRATPALLVDAGSLLGRIHRIFDKHAFDHPGLHRYHQWDQRNTADLLAFTKCVEVEERRQLVEGVIERFKKEILGRQEGLRKSPLQADFNDANIIISNSAEKPLGVIDYGDIVHGWLVSDVAIGAAYATVSSYGQEHPFAAPALLIHGFVQCLQLTELEKQLLPLLTTCRLTTSVVIGAFSYQQQPECKYLLLHAEPAWTSLEALTAVHLERDIVDLFQRACEPATCRDALLDMALKIENKLKTA